MASKDLLEAILGTDPGELNAARARVMASKGKGDINVVADVEKEVKRAPQSAISVDATDLATVSSKPSRSLDKCRGAPGDILGYLFRLRLIR